MYLFFPPNESGTNFRCKMAHFVAFTTKLRRYPEHHPNFPPDASLVLDDGSRHAVHRLILGANSKFFKSMFQFDKTKKIFTLEKVNQKDLTTFLDYAYTKEIRLTMSNIKDNLKFANYIDCQEILEIGKDFLLKKVTPNTASKYLKFARDQQLLDIQKELEMKINPITSKFIFLAMSCSNNIDDFA